MAEDRILLDHGAGGKASHRLITQRMLPAFDNPALRALDDGAVLEMPPGRLAFSTDTFVVDPIFFPGGDIGELAVHGTVNDVAMCGAKPLFLSVAMVIEEGLPMEDLDRIVESMAKAAAEAGVQVVTGDTKVVPRGAADRIFINTSGIGVIPDGVDLGPHRVRAGDAVLVSGTIADHGMAILTRREGLEFSTPIESDCASLNGMAAALMETCPGLRCLRDPTRGGVGTTLNEISESSGLGIRIMEDGIPVARHVAGACEMLGFDPLYVANEGKMLVFVAEEDADTALSVLKADPLGENAARIGTVVAEPAGKVYMETRIGGSRIVDMLTGEQLPRIC
ncbi:MAG: hydrogenase expression/formation protein HypE [Desulfatibacillaceae bacterium]